MIQHSHFVGFPDHAHTKYVHWSTTGDPASEQRALRLHLARLSRKLLTVHHILLQGGSPIVSGITGQGHVCVSVSDVLTPHQMTDVLELKTGEHLLKCSEEWTIEPLTKPPSGSNIASHSTGMVEMRTPLKRPLSHCSACSRILSFELISNNSASIDQMKATVITTAIR